MRDLVLTLLEEFYLMLNSKQQRVERDYAFPNVPDLIKVAIGMRRTGKTGFMFQTISEMLLQGISREQILYINFEDDRLFPCDRNKLAELLENFYSIYPQNHKRICYLFLDEIQNIPEWELVIRRFNDSKQVEIYLSGSSAKLLSKDLHTSLRGRSTALEIWPFSFAEFLKAFHYEIPKLKFSKQSLDEINEYFLKYIEQGGFPAVVFIDKVNRISMLQEYAELVIIKDIVERYKVDNIVLLKYLLQTILKNVASGFSANKFTKDIKSQGIRGSKSTVLEYLQYLEDAFLIFPVPMYSESIRQIQANHKKMYAVDTGLVNACTFSRNKNLGHLFENIFYLWLRRNKYKIHYYLTQDERFEVDFLAQSPEGKLHLYQICWDINEADTLHREQRALEIAKEELNIEGTLITPEIFLKEFLR